MLIYFISLFVCLLSVAGFHYGAKVYWRRLKEQHPGFIFLYKDNMARVFITLYGLYIFSFVPYLNIVLAITFTLVYSYYILEMIVKREIT